MVQEKKRGFITSVSWIPTRFCKPLPENENPTFVSEAFRELKKGFSENCDEDTDGSNDEANITVDDDAQWEDVGDGLCDVDDGSEVEDDMINPTDLVALTTRVSDDPQSTIEMFLYDTSTDVLYLHHDGELPGTPLSLAWVGQWSSGMANIAVVGDREGGISCWNMDLRNAVRPVAMLGGPMEIVNRKKNQRRHVNPKFGMSPDGHQDAVLAVKWNQTVGNILASASSDSTIRLWNLETVVSERIFATSHEDKVQTIDWNSIESHLLLSGGFDARVVLHDCRSDSVANSIRVSCCPEQVLWTGKDTFVVSLTDGSVHAYDSRRLDKVVGCVRAHDANAIVTFSPHHCGLMASGGKDGYIKLWDMRKNASNYEPFCTRRLGVGEVFGLAFHPNTPSMLLAGGSHDRLLVYSLYKDIQGVF